MPDRLRPNYRWRPAATSSMSHDARRESLSPAAEVTPAAVQPAGPETATPLPSGRFGHHLGEFSILPPPDAPLSPVQREGHGRIEPAQPVWTGERLPMERPSAPLNLGQRIRQVQGGGQPLDPGVQRTLESGLGTDLSGIRIHTDGEADRLSRSVDASAVTTGPDIFFRHGTYNPGTPGGMHLLTHEAVHTVQQARGPVAGTPRPDGVSISDPGDSFERAAEESAAGVTRGSIQRISAAPAAHAGDSAIDDGVPVQRALWVIEPKEGKQKHELSKEAIADLKRLTKTLPATDFPSEKSFTKAQAETPAATVIQAGDRDFHVLAHAGLVDAPWIGGLYLQEFAHALVTKYGAVTLDGATLWLLVCHIGQDAPLQQLAADIVGEGVQNITIYAPMSYMFISRRGIPHVYHDDGDDYSPEDMAKLVAKYDASWTSLGSQGFMASGARWGGVTVVNGAIARIGGLTVEGAVRTKFDSDEKEV